MTKRQRLTRNRLRICLAFAFFLFTVFGLRLFQIQGIDSQAYASMAITSGTTRITVPATRGEITDRNGVALASSTEGLTLTADPSMTAANATQIARILVQKLGSKVDYFDAVDKLRRPKSRYVVIVHQIPKWNANVAIDAIAKAGYTGVFSEKESIRTYPGSSLAANMIGYLNGAGKGVAGLEQQYDAKLTGKDGSSTFEVSPSGQRIPLADSTMTKMTPGSNVTTTIDRDLQWYSDQRLADAVKSANSDWGLAITVDIQTGQILAMSQAPTFNPDTRTGMTAANTVARAFQTVYEPGSVQKTVTMSSLADQGKISPDSKIVVPPSVVVDGFRIGDYWQHGTIQLTAAGVIAKSSNLGTIVAASKMNDQTMHDYLTRFGFGTKTGVTLPGESSGILSPASAWTRASHDTIAFGQGISVTALQMVRAVSTIANGGVMIDPSVVSGFTGPDGKKTILPVNQGRRVVSAKAAAAVTRMMEAVTAPNGTAPAAAITGYRVAGKTGTAWRVNPVTGKYVHGQNTVSFMGFAPADNPRFLTYIVLDKPFANAGGGATAAPVFHDIMSMALERFGVAPTGSKSPKVPLTW